MQNKSDSYRWYGFGAKMVFGPKYWLYAGPADARYRDRDGGNICPIATQQGFYDWRDPGEVMCEQMDRFGTVLNGLASTMKQIMEMPRVITHDEPGPGYGIQYRSNETPYNGPRHAAEAARRRESGEGGA